MLTTLHRFNAALGIRTRCYWSSKGSRDEYSSEWLLLSLVHPLCLVKSVSVRPFRATFQRVQPWFSPALICSAGSGSLTHAAVCTLLHLHASPAGTGIGISHESFILLPAGRACSLAVHECCILQGIVTSGTSSRHIANAWCLQQRMGKVLRARTWRDWAKISATSHPGLRNAGSPNLLLQGRAVHLLVRRAAQAVHWGGGELDDLWEEENLWVREYGL